MCKPLKYHFQLTQVIYDLLEKSSGHLELREDPTQGIVVAGLRSIKVLSLPSMSIIDASKILDIIITAIAESLHKLFYKSQVVILAKEHEWFVEISFFRSLSL